MSTNTIDNIAVFWSFLMILSLLLGFLDFIFVRNYKVARDSYKRRFLILGIVLIIQAPLTFKFGFHLFDTIESRSRLEIIKILNSSSCQAVLNDIKLDKDKSTEIIEELSKIKKAEPHHSHPTNVQHRITILCGQEKTLLILIQDSKIHNEYWVFWNKYNSTKSNELGRIISDKLKKDS